MNAAANRAPYNASPSEFLFIAMVNATAGLLVSCDIPVKEFLLWLDESQHNKFIIMDLDETHLFVQESALPFLQEELNKLYEENQYSFIQ